MKRIALLLTVACIVASLPIVACSAEKAIEPTKKIVSAVKAVHPDLPIIGFPRAAGANYLDYIAETGVDMISVGALTHSAPALDLSMLFTAAD